MIILKNLRSFVVTDSDSIRTSLRKIESNKKKMVYVVDASNRLLGAFADGDFRRWIITQSKVDLDKPVVDVYNRDCFSMPYESTPADITAALNKSNLSIPLVNERGNLVALADRGARFYEINNRRISDEDPAYLIAEIGNNHQGDIVLAKRLISLAAKAGVDSVKFQMRDMESLYGNSNLDSHDLGSQYTMDLLSRFQLKDEDLYEAFDYCYEVGVTPLCTPWDVVSLQKLEAYGIPGYKVASADFTNFELLEEISKTGKVMICSTGMSTEDEIRSTIEFLERRKAQFILLHCNSTYPTPFKDINLKYIERIKKLSQTLVGYSGHERGWAVATASVCLGAKVIEKHFTVDKTLEGNDHKVSLLPEELSLMVRDIRALEQALGTDKPRSLTQGEMLNREVLAKSLYASVDIKLGEPINAEMIEIRSPGNGLQPNKLSELIGKKARRNIRLGDAFFESDIKGGVIKKARYNFDRPYGIPVRYHDYRELINGVNLDFVEIHLSYSDMKLDISQYLDKESKIGFAVHAPELFENDHLLDLSSYDDAYREQSITHLESVIKHTLELSTYFPLTEKPVIVVNAGGWNAEGFWPKSEVREKYSIVERSLARVNAEGVRLAIQTMPPFPWHFGGQSYHSLFVEADEIVEFCEKTGVGICLDVSHSMMACNYAEVSIYDFVEKVAPYVIHLHIVDAKGVDGEGVQIGKGDVDFGRIGEILKRKAPGVQFIPEIWQGHKNRGEGFWYALSFLENKL